MQHSPVSVVSSPNPGAKEVFTLAQKQERIQKEMTQAVVEMAARGEREGFIK